jgi:hypothetical protein
MFCMARPRWVGGWVIGLLKNHSRQANFTCRFRVLPGTEEETLSLARGMQIARKSSHAKILGAPRPLLDARQNGHLRCGAEQHLGSLRRCPCRVVLDPERVISVDEKLEREATDRDWTLINQNNAGGGGEECVQRVDISRMGMCRKKYFSKGIAMRHSSRDVVYGNIFRPCRP